MSDVSELAPRLRYLCDRNAGTFIGDMFGEAADALETLAGENARLIRAWEAKQSSQSAATAEAEVMFRLSQEAAAERDALSARLAKLEPVVEAARQVLAHSSGFEGDLSFCKKMAALESALATLEAAHD